MKLLCDQQKAILLGNEGFYNKRSHLGKSRLSTKTKRGDFAPNMMCWRISLSSPAYAFPSAAFLLPRGLTFRNSWRHTTPPASDTGRQADPPGACAAPHWALCQAAALKVSDGDVLDEAMLPRMQSWDEKSGWRPAYWQVKKFLFAWEGKGDFFACLLGDAAPMCVPCVFNAILTVERALL